MAPGEMQVWLNHFEYHAQHPHHVPEYACEALRPAERRLIACSIATFQLAERTRSAGLARAAGQFSRAHGMPMLERIMALLVVEEQRHALMLRTYMQAHRIPPRGCGWADRIAGQVRRLAGFEAHLNMLISAELIGIVYYRALESATRCRRLKVLCRVLVADELAHVGFESQLLLGWRDRRSPGMRALVRAVHRTFFALHAGLTWLRHRAVLRRGGYDLVGFARACLAQYAFYLEPPLRASRMESSRSCSLSSSPLSLRASSLISISARRLTSKSSSPRSRSRVFWRF